MASMGINETSRKDCLSDWRGTAMLLGSLKGKLPE
jgi:hypothetical protein